MVAQRENQTIRNDRNSALIVLANARVWESEGWQVTITDANGKQFDPAGFESLLTQAHSSLLQAMHSSDKTIQAAAE
jgi:hypothetical protein